eukprot:309496-Pelagomonas_calceolata.AAC.1
MQQQGGGQRCKVWWPTHGSRHHRQIVDSSRLLVLVVACNVIPEAATIGQEFVSVDASMKRLKITASKVGVLNTRVPCRDCTTEATTQAKAQCNCFKASQCSCASRLYSAAVLQGFTVQLQGFTVQLCFKALQCSCASRLYGAAVLQGFTVRGSSCLSSCPFHLKDIILRVNTLLMLVFRAG